MLSSVERTSSCKGGLEEGENPAEWEVTRLRILKVRSTTPVVLCSRIGEILMIPTQHLEANSFIRRRRGRTETSPQAPKHRDGCMHETLEISSPALPCPRLPNITAESSLLEQVTSSRPTSIIYTVMAFPFRIPRARAPLSSITNTTGKCPVLKGRSLLDLMDNPSPSLLKSYWPINNSNCSNSNSCNINSDYRCISNSTRNRSITRMSSMYSTTPILPTTRITTLFGGLARP